MARMPKIPTAKERQSPAWIVKNIPATQKNINALYAEGNIAGAEALAAVLARKEAAALAAAQKKQDQLKAAFESWKSTNAKRAINLQKPLPMPSQFQQFITPAPAPVQPVEPAPVPISTTAPQQQYMDTVNNAAPSPAQVPAVSAQVGMNQTAQWAQNYLEPEAADAYVDNEAGKAAAAVVAGNAYVPPKEVLTNSEPKSTVEKYLPIAGALGAAFFMFRR